MKMVEGLCTYSYFILWTFWHFKFESLKNGNLELWNLTIPKYWNLKNVQLRNSNILFSRAFYFWKFEGLNCWNLTSLQFENLHRKMMKNPVKNSSKYWILISYLLKTWNGHLITFVFSSQGFPSTPQHTDPSGNLSGNPFQEILLSRNRFWETFPETFLAILSRNLCFATTHLLVKLFGHREVMGISWENHRNTFRRFIGIFMQFLW